MFDIPSLMLRTAIRTLIGDFKIRHVPKRKGVELVNGSDVEFMSYPDLADNFERIVNGDESSLAEPDRPAASVAARASRIGQDQNAADQAAAGGV